MNHEIFNASPEFARDICYIRKKSWLNAYENPTLNITRTSILNHYDFTSPQAIAEFKAHLETLPEDEKLFVAGIKLPIKKKSGNENKTGGSKADGNKANKTHKIFGFSACNRADNIITMLYVAPAFANRGIGTALYQAALNALNRSLDVRVVVVSYNERARFFYERRGFVVTGDEIPPAGDASHPPSLFPCLDMVLRPEKQN